MSRRLCRLADTALLLIPLMALSACANQAPPSRATAAARSACRAHADDVFLRQNSDAIYRSDNYSSNLRDSPFGSSGLPGLTTTGLSQQFGIDNTMQDCLNGMGDSPAATEAVPPGQPPVPSSVSSGAAAPSTVK
jgi:hypothetical protein